MSEEAGPMRSDKDVVESIQAVENAMVKHVVDTPPELFVHLPILRAVCFEVLDRRQQDRGEATDHAVSEAVKAEELEKYRIEPEPDRLSMDDDSTGRKNADPIGSDGRKGLRDQLTDLMNHRSREGLSQTPDYLLAEYLIQCLVAYETTVRQRDHFHGVKL